ncbi:MAG: hypothetical protein KME45_26820 [Stenomitos rutilans HA7619-LM2]|jgi:hypothetical protein|nr:hypothetical protein [Stenomitos rutilans HA7619-LM2]
MPKSYRLLIVALLVTAFAGGCRSTEEYQKLSEAGTAYTNALDSLLTVAGNKRLDASSELLLKSRAFVPQTIEDYKKRTTADIERLIVLEDIRRHNQLLARYFDLINQLASSNAPETVQKEIGSTVDSLNKVGNKLRGSDFITNKAAIQGIAGLVVSGQIRGALGEELSKRKDTINLEFITQKELLLALSESLQQDIKVIKEQQESRFVIKPFVSTTTVNNARASSPIDDDGWITQRRTILTMEATAAELESASSAMSEFNEVFKDFVEGKLNQGRLNSLLSDIESFVSVVEKLKPSQLKN